MQPQGAATWGARAEMLRGIIKLILKVRSPQSEALETVYGTSRRITSLAPFGILHLSGLLRRPVFVSGDATTKVVAVNAWQWAEEGKAARVQLHEISYKNFKRGTFKSDKVQQQLVEASARRMEEDPVARSIGTASASSTNARKQAF